jgi:hypothetical protein
LVPAEQKLKSVVFHQLILRIEKAFFSINSINWIENAKLVKQLIYQTVLVFREVWKEIVVIDFYKELNLWMWF